MNGYVIFPKILGLEPNHPMQFSAIPSFISSSDATLIGNNIPGESRTENNGNV